MPGRVVRKMPTDSFNLLQRPLTSTLRVLHRLSAACSGGGYRSRALGVAGRPQKTGKRESDRTGTKSEPGTAPDARNRHATRSKHARGLIESRYHFCQSRGNNTSYLFFLFLHFQAVVSEVGIFLVLYFLQILYFRFI